MGPIDDKQKALYEEQKVLVRSLVLPHQQNGISPNFLNRDYADIEGREIPYKECGFESLQEMLYHMKDTVRWAYSKEGFRNLFAVANEDTAHIADMVQHQMKKKKRKPAPKRFTFNRPYLSSFGRTVPAAMVNRSAMMTNRSATMTTNRTTTAFRSAGAFNTGGARYQQRLGTSSTVLASNVSQSPVNWPSNTASTRPPPQPFKPTVEAGSGDAGPSNAAVLVGPLSKGHIPVSVQNELVAFLSRYKPDGIAVANFDLLFKHEMKHQFIAANYGYMTSEAALQSLPVLIALVVGAKGALHVKLVEWLPKDPRLASRTIASATPQQTTSSPVARVPSPPKDPRLERSVVMIKRRTAMAAATSKAPIESAPASKPLVKEREKISFLDYNDRPPLGFGRGRSAVRPGNDTVTETDWDFDSLEPIVLTKPVPGQFDDKEFNDEQARNTFRNILKSNPKGIPLPEFYETYKKFTNGQEPDLKRWGVGSFVELIHCLPSIITAIPPHPSNNELFPLSADTWILFSAETAAADMKVKAQKARQDEEWKSVGLRKPRVTVPDVVSSAQKSVSNQLSPDIRLKLLKIIFYHNGVPTNKISEVFYWDYHQTFVAENFGFNSIKELIEAQRGFPVKIRDDEDGVPRLQLDRYAYYQFVAEQVKAGHAKDIVALAETSEDIVRPGEHYPDIDLEEKGLLSGTPGDVGEATWKAVIISAVTHPRAFYVYLHKHKNRLSRIMTSLDFYNEHSSPNFMVPEAWLHVGLVIAAIFPVDGLWHRAVIKKINESGEITVLFVDYGGMDTVNRSDIRLLRRDLFEDPAFALKVAIYGVLANDCDSTWDVDARELLLDFSKSEVEDPKHTLACSFYKREKPLIEQPALYTKPLAYCDLMYEVVLCDTTTEDDVYLADKLIESKTAIRINNRCAQKILQGTISEHEVLLKHMASLSISSCTVSNFLTGS